jgi:Ig domain of plant-specific actin-binding protein
VMMEGPLAVLLHPSRGSNAVVPDDTPNHAAWAPPAVLQVGADMLPVVVNPPTAASISLHPRVMAKHALLPAVALQYAELGSCQWQWHRVSPDDGAPLLVGTAMMYTPDEQDIGCTLRVTCTPYAVDQATPGEPVSATSGVGHVVHGARHSLVVLYSPAVHTFQCLPRCVA